MRQLKGLHVARVSRIKKGQIHVETLSWGRKPGRGVGRGMEASTRRNTRQEETQETGGEETEQTERKHLPAAAKDLLEHCAQHFVLSQLIQIFRTLLGF